MFSRKIFHFFGIFKLGTMITGETHFIKIIHTADAGRNKTHCGNSETEAGAVGKAVKILIIIPPVESLAGSLTVTHRQKETACGEGAEQVGEHQGDQQADNSLHKIAADGDSAGVENIAPGLFTFDTVEMAPGKGDEAKTETVISQGFQGGKAEHGVSEKTFIQRIQQ